MSLTSSKLGWPRRRRPQSQQTRETGVGWSAVLSVVSRETTADSTGTPTSTAAESDAGTSAATPSVTTAESVEDDVSRETTAESADPDAESVVVEPTTNETSPESQSAPDNQPAPETEQSPETEQRAPAAPVDPAPRPAATRIMTVSNQKGGVGKTTTTVNLAAALAIAGQKVLVIDLDPQGNASTGLSIEHPPGTPSTYDVIVDKMPLEKAAQPVSAPGVPDGYLFCVPATGDLAGAEVELAGVMVGREFRLRQAIGEYLDRHTGDDRFDYVFIDCPPSLGLLTVNALAAGAEVLIPVQCEYYALEGLGQLLETVELIKGYLNPNLHVSTMLLTMFDARTKLAGQVVDEVRAHFGDTVMRSIIPRSVKVSEAPSYGMSVISYDPTSRGAIAYDSAARELTTRN